MHYRYMPRVNAPARSQAFRIPSHWTCIRRIAYKLWEDVVFVASLGALFAAVMAIKEFAP